MPNFAKIAHENGFRKINSVYPVVSSVAWTTYATGKNPGEHGIFGFVDRTANPFQLTIPTAQDRKADTIWHELSKQGKRVIVINVPLTYPPEPVNGIMISCFLCPDINKLCYPSSISQWLITIGYVIDVDAAVARKSRKEFLDLLNQALDKRFEVAFKLMQKEKWDFFQLHIMETDRLFHFFWDDLEKEDRGDFYSELEGFCTRLDNHIGELITRLSSDDKLLILSDHGFCGIKSEVQLNTWFEKEGLLKFEVKNRTSSENKLEDYHKDSVCYSLIPGRIYVNLKGREEKGTVLSDDLAKVRCEIRQRLLEFRHPGTNDRVIDRVFFKEELYEGPYLEDSADIICQPVRGYDLKASSQGNVKNIFEKTALNGMHTYDDALICGRNLDTSSVTCLQDIREKCLKI